MKLLMIITDGNEKNLIEKMIEKDFQITKLSSTGGFLQAKNTTLLSAVQDERVIEALEIIEVQCGKKKTTLEPSNPLGAMLDEKGNLPSEIILGGATVFVLSIEEYRKY